MAFFNPPSRYVVFPREKNSVSSEIPPQIFHFVAIQNFISFSLIRVFFSPGFGPLELLWKLQIWQRHTSVKHVLGALEWFYTTLVCPLPLPCGEISDFYTWQMWIYLKCCTSVMWRHEEKFQISTEHRWREIWNSPHLSNSKFLHMGDVDKSEISPHHVQGVHSEYSLFPPYILLWINNLCHIF